MLLVHVCTFCEDSSSCTHFELHVICAHSHLYCTGIAQTHFMFSERSQKLQKKVKEVYRFKATFRMDLDTFVVAVGIVAACWTTKLDQALDILPK